MSIDISELIGKTFDRVVKSDDNEYIEFLSQDNSYRMEHLHDCCEVVEVEDVCGDLADLEGMPIVLAYEATSSECCDNTGDESFTWTFYHLATRKGYVTIRWYGCSNGYYSEGVDIIRLAPQPTDESPTPPYRLP